MVNRLERLAGELGVSVAISRAFAQHLPEPLVNLGEHQLRGVRETQEVFTIYDAAIASTMDRMWLEIEEASSKP